MTNKLDKPLDKELDINSLSDPVVSSNALTVLNKRYLIKNEKGEVVETPKEMYYRVAKTVASSEKESSRARWAEVFYNMMATNEFMPNSPTLMNAGRSMGMLSACFVVPVTDSITGIFDGIKSTALIQKAGGGTGFNFSRLRPTNSIVKSSGGTTSGPLSFIDVFSKATDAIQQGAFRRGANMGILDVTHPDIISFIKAKQDLKRWQNYNISVAMTNEFMKTLIDNPDTQHRVHHDEWGSGKLWQHLDNGEIKAVLDSDVDKLPLLTDYRPWTVENTWDLICTRAHSTGEPGLFFIDKANETNPVPNLGRITSTNPCGEQDLHDYDSCNLGSINLNKFLHKNNTINFEKLHETVCNAVRFLDDVIDVNNYPIPEIEKQSKKTRRIGLGVMGFADILFKKGIAYNTPTARSLAEQIQKFITETARDYSEDLAIEKGPFGAYVGSNCTTSIRNSYRTTIAPTGTISIISNCSGGIEPKFSLSFIRQVMKDASGVSTIMTEVTEEFDNFLGDMKISNKAKEEVYDHVLEHGSISKEHMKTFPELSHFVTAQQISPEDHVKMQAAWQKHIDSAVSKTINLNRDATVEEVDQAYKMAYLLGCKGITVYRDGCRDGAEGMVQPMSVKQTANLQVADPPKVQQDIAKYVNQKESNKDNNLCKEAKRLKLATQWGTLHVFVTIENGKETEIFAQVGKAGDLMYSDLEAMCRLASCWLQTGGTITDVVGQLDGIGSTQVGLPGPHGKISSLPDALCKALKQYIEYKEGVSDSTPSNSEAFQNGYGTPCPQCGPGRLVFQEGCKKCLSCGYSAC